jgi:4-amino-4-deoxy-L-arabinose transferase-like glycosyltransferase
VVLVATAVFLGCIVSPPGLMDDVDSVQAQIARNMLVSGDWVSARLNGVLYLEKSPLIYWLMAAGYTVFGVKDWAARLPVALSAVVLCWLTYCMGRWAFSAKAGFYAGLSIATCIGLWLFTRIQIPDVTVTVTIALALWALLRTLDEEEPRPRLWAAVMAAAIGTGLLLKGLIAIVFPVGAALLYLGLSGQLFSARTWRRLRPLSGALIILFIAAPWHIAATLANPPYFDFTMKSEPGKYRGFFWFYLLNEHVLRFLNLRHPRDYNTVPRLQFWLFHLLWLFPWSVFFPAAALQRFRPVDSAGRMRLLALCWAAFLLVFFTFSTTQEYYTMPAYPAFALLIGSALASGGSWIAPGRALFSTITFIALLAILAILTRVWNLPAPGDISRALVQNPEAYTLSLGHMGDLTLASFAYLKLPLLIAGLAMFIGSTAWRLREQPGLLAMALAMLTLFHAARLALVAFDPYLGSRALAEAYLRQPPGDLILDNQYYTFSSVFFYAQPDRAFLLNGRVNNLEYGSYAPGAPDVFIDETEFVNRWTGPARHYLLAEKPQLPRFERLVGTARLRVVAESGGKFLFTNH